MHQIVVDWNRFDENHLNRFETVEIDYSAVKTEFVLPEDLPSLTHGTVVTVKKLRKPWDREAILHLKSALAKLINPFGASADNFSIEIHAPKERGSDALERIRATRNNEEITPNSVVNGEVGNFIFASLEDKTTFTDVGLNSDGELIESYLVDRGELIYRIRERNIYPLLRASAFKCRLFFLNQSAKMTFARRMGVPSIRFGSVLLFRNGIRVYPVGEEGNDWFGIDARKQQGYARYLGSRDLIGRVDVAGRASQLQEASSRNDGLIETPTVVQLKECFLKNGLKRLERYVVPVTFVDKEDKNTSDISRLLSDPGEGTRYLSGSKTC